MNILLFCQFKEGFNNEFKKRIEEISGNSEVDYYDDSWSEQEYHRKLENADVIIGHTRPSDLKFCKKLKLMQMDIAGADAYINSPDFPKNAVLCSASGAYGVILAEHAVGLVMALCRQIHNYSIQKKEHIWKRIVPIKSSEGSSVLIVGAGDIGTNTARLLRPMVGKIVGVRRVKREMPDCFDEMIGIEALDRYLPEADIVICSLPATKSTFHLMNADRLRLMKDDAVLVNVGRGDLIPMDDLVSVLNEGKLYGAGLDVFETEPIPENHPVWACDRLIITPHAAGKSVTQDSPTNLRIYDIIYSTLSKFLNGKELDHVVDKKTGYRKTIEK